jgi:arabinose-5-phosphate isomerase
VTDGDLRRALHRHDRIDPLRVGQLMSSSPRTIDRDATIARAVERMERNLPGPITALVVVDAAGRVEGILHLHDCLRARPSG